MRTLWIATALMAACGFAAAQSVVPTTDNLGNDQINVGTKQAQVNQTVNLKLPEATALHLDTSNLVFDISQIGRQDASWYCAYGKDDPDGVPKDADTLAQDIVLAPDAELWGQQQVLPLGTYYETKDKFGEISVVAGPQVKAYPPILAVNNEVDNATKAYFVCYRSFILQKFSNLGNFKLTVKRDNPTNGRGRQLMYIQDNPCAYWGDKTGLYNLPNGAVRELIPRALTVGTTGHVAASASELMTKNGKPGTCRGLTSWLDDLVVVAVVVDGDMAGDNVATLTYTLDSSAAPFTAGANTPYGNP